MLTIDRIPTHLNRFGRATRFAAAAAGLSLLALGCSVDDASTVYPDDTVFGEADITVTDVEVEDGTEDGLDLDTDIAE